MGGAERIQRLHERGERTIREHIDGLLDAGSFEEVGTFTHSARPEDAAATPGDGKIGGQGLGGGRAGRVGRGGPAGGGGRPHPRGRAGGAHPPSPPPPGAPATRWSTSAPR